MGSSLGRISQFPTRGSSENSSNMVISFAAAPPISFVSIGPSYFNSNDSACKVSSSRAQPQQIQIAHKVPQNGSTENIRAPPQQLQLVAELPQISSTEGIQQDVPELSAVKECIQEDLPFTEEEIPGLDADLPLAEAEILGSDVDSSRFILQNPDIADGSVVDNQRELDPGEKTKVMDTNGDGNISRLELRELLLLLCLGHEKSTTWKASEEMIREMDLNGDGDIDLEEFMHAVVVSE
ncbi:hypothetical protein V6N11_070920 [Hibiscus sabdariffa]|uniref:EF-hand domain-containing protein n=1 Tax=Hibiscus sabdariffa TaxID=183260 RepID=A0ABR2A3A3_9ROSI